MHAKRKVRPPCDTCDYDPRNSELAPENRLAWSIWTMANATRPVSMVSTGMGAAHFMGRLSMSDMLELCDLYGGTNSDLEKLVLIEEVVWPTLNKGGR